MAQEEWLGIACPILSHKGAVHETISMGRAQQMRCIRVVVSAIRVPSLSVLSFIGFTSWVARQIYPLLGPLMSILRLPANSHIVVVRQSRSKARVEGLCKTKAMNTQPHCEQNKTKQNKTHGVMRLLRRRLYWPRHGEPPAL